MDYATFIQGAEPHVIAYYDQVHAAFCQHWPERDAEFWCDYLMRVLTTGLSLRTCPPVPSELGMDWSGGW
jgi:hypothetical protein